MMKADIEIVTGFIGSGKTTFINGLLEETLEKNERVVVLQLEEGETEIEEKFKGNEKITLIRSNYHSLTEKNFAELLKKKTPHRVIIEFNGTEEIQELLDIIHSKTIKPLCKLTCTYYVSEGSNFQSYLNNMGRFLLPCVQITNLVVLNNSSDISKNTLENINIILKQHNKFVPILEVQDHSLMKESIKSSNLFHRGLLKKCDLFFKELLNIEHIKFNVGIRKRKAHGKE